MRRAGWFALLFSASALAVSLGDSLTIRAPKTEFRASAAAGAKVLEVLEPGQTVTFQGRDEKNPEFLLVKVGEKEGVVPRAAVSTVPLQEELVASGSLKVDAEAFARGGAAQSVLAPATAAYAEEKVYRTGYDQLLTVDRLARSVTDQDVAAHAKSAGLAGGGK